MLVRDQCVCVTKITGLIDIGKENVTFKNKGGRSRLLSDVICWSFRFVGVGASEPKRATPSEQENFRSSQPTQYNSLSGLLLFCK